MWCAVVWDFLCFVLGLFGFFLISFYLLSLQDEVSSLSARVISDCQTAKLNGFHAAELLEKVRKKIKLSSDDPG